MQFQSAPGSGVLTVSVWDTQSAVPGTLEHTLTHTGTIEPGFVRFTAPNNAQLAANTYYFVHLTFSGSELLPN